MFKKFSKSLKYKIYFLVSKDLFKKRPTVKKGVKMASVKKKKGSGQEMAVMV